MGRRLSIVGLLVMVSLHSLELEAAMTASLRRKRSLQMRGGTSVSPPVVPRERSIVRRWIDAIKAFFGSFFDPSFGGIEEPVKPVPVAAAKRSFVSKGAPRRAKKVTVEDLKEIQGGTVQAVGTEAEFARKIASKKLTVCDFWATWCGPCQQMKPKFAKISDRHAKKASFLAVDVDKAKPIAQKYAVSSMPTFVFFKEGKELTRFSGADENKLDGLISRLA